MSEVRNIINEIESNPAIEAAVLISGKPGCFIAGADIGMIESCKTKEQVVTLSKAGMSILCTHPTNIYILIYEPKNFGPLFN